MCCLNRTFVGAGMAAVVAVAVLAGCESQERLRPDLPRTGQRLVGGGLKITWMAPEAGTAYLVEKKTGKVVETQSLPAGGMYHFAVETIVQAQDMENLLGVDIDDTEFQLYFEPAGSQPGTPQP